MSDEKKSETKGEREQAQQTFPSRLAESQQRRQAAHDTPTPTKRERNRDWKKVPRGRFATD